MVSRFVTPESLANPYFSRFLPSHPALSRVSQLSCLFTTTAGAISSYNDDDLLDALISIFAAIAIEDWNDNSAAAFIKDISDAIGRINEYVESKGNDQDDGRLLITIDGVQVEKTFTAEAISPLGKTAFNNLKSIFEEYNDALEPDEQLAILAKLIGEIIH